MEILKPCPFCGSEAHTYESKYLFGWVTECLRATDGLCIGTGRVSCNREKTIRFWNTRTSGWISVDDSLPEAHEYVVLKHKDDGVPPTIGWATYWQPKNRFAGFEVQCASYLEDYSNEFTHWMPLPQMPEVKHG